jgi:hypothetical protein
MYAAVIARSIPMEIANAVLEGGGQGRTTEDIAIATGRTPEEIEKHAPAARRIIARQLAGQM